MSAITAGHDPATLHAVFNRLTERIDETARITGSDSLRVAIWVQARNEVKAMLDAADPRVRTVVLPGADEVDDTFASWKKGSIRASSAGEPWVSYLSGHTTPELAAVDAGRILAAVEFARGAQ